MTNKASHFYRLITASSIGTILEWYDFSLFAYLSPLLAKHFFPHENAVLALMLTYAVFAVGYLVRPLGAMIFGHMGDRFGRKKTLIWTILLMSIPTFLMGLVPTYASIGIAAPILLIALRILQGISAGGESTGAVLFVLESVEEKRRGFMGALIWSMVGIGMLLGSFAATIVAHYESVSWAWRVPFLLGILTGIIGYFLRRKTLESLQFADLIKSKAQKKYPLLIGLTKYKKAMLTIMGVYVLSAMITYLIFVFMPTYASSIVGLPLAETTKISTAAYLLVTLLVPLGGYFSDRFNRKACLLMGALGFVLLSYPLFYLIAQGSIPGFMLAESIFLLLAVIFQGTVSAVVFNLVPTAVRYSAIAVSYNVSFSLFGGTAPFIATYLVNATGNKAAPGLYLMMGAVIALFAIIKGINNEKIAGE
jgi:MHS family proline/betaine transporter-like MFS transporter